MAAESRPVSGSVAVPGARLAKNDPREITGWALYDWANSAFSTTVGTALLAPYLTALAQARVGENGVVLALGPLGVVTAKSFVPYAISLSVALQVLLLPLLGALADYTHLKKRLMALACYVGVLATCLLVFIDGGRYLAGALLFIVANVAFGASIVFYNAYLPDIASEDQGDRVSSLGFALGYLGGGILLALNLVLVVFAKPLGLSTGLAVRLSLLSAGLWWGGFALVTFRRLRDRAPVKHLPPGQHLLTVGFRALLATLRDAGRLPQTLRYLLGYMLYNDGIQTVIALSSVFLSQELFVARGRPVNQTFLLGLILMVQFVAFAGALLFNRIAALLDTKRAILLSLVIWSGVVIYAYGFLRTVTEAWLLGAAIALVLGGSQALSRSLFARMIPAGREAAFFGLYEISERGTSWIGPLIFGFVVGATNSYRQAILSLIVLFIAGMIVLALTDTARAIHDAGNALPEEAAATTVAVAG